MSFQNNPLHSCEYSFSHNVRNNLVSSFNSRVTHFKSWDISCMNIIEKLRTFFLTPKYTFGTKNAQKACSWTPSNWVRRTVSWCNQVSPEALAKFWRPAGSKKLLCWGTCRKLRCTAFRICLSWGGVALVEVGQKKDFLQKSAEKTAFLRDTNRDHLTLEGHNSLNFKDFRLSQGCFGKFGT